MMTKEQTWARLVQLSAVAGEIPKNRWNLSGANLSGANLSEVYLLGANLIEANLIEANLSGAHLLGAYLSGAYLSGADLSRAYLLRADLSEAHLSEANLSEANLLGADLSRADLSGANLHEADLTDATLTAAVLIKTDLTKANLSGACIDDANVSGWIIKDVTCSHIIEAKSGKQIKIGFEPQEFEKKYTQIRKTAEVITYLSGGKSMTDLQRLIEKYEKRMAELEAQIEALRGKHDILVEAARLLEEEAQTPDVSCK